MQDSRSGAERDGQRQGGLDIYLVRHAVAHKRDPERWPDDRLRPLTSEGEKDFRRVARGIGALKVEIRAVLSSPLTRAWQTAEILESEARWPAPKEFEELAPEIPPGEVLSALAAWEEIEGQEALALVGHRPNLHELASYMISGDPYRVEVKLKKGGVAAVRFRDGLRAGEGVLRGLVSPGLLLPGG
jgi:phosphohistidine phosphatase